MYIKSANKTKKEYINTTIYNFFQKTQKNVKHIVLLDNNQLENSNNILQMYSRHPVIIYVIENEIESYEKKRMKNKDTRINVFFGELKDFLESHEFQEKISLLYADLMDTLRKNTELLKVIQKHSNKFDRKSLFVLTYCHRDNKKRYLRDLQRSLCDGINQYAILENFFYRDFQIRQKIVYCNMTCCFFTK
jgi:hypothetical protein